MIKKNKKTLYLVFLVLNSFALNAQNSFDTSYSQAELIYKKMIGVNAHLYNGNEYIDYDHRITGNPFFQSSYFTNGSVVFDDILYTDVMIFYDILNDDLVLKNYNNIPLILTKEKVSSFSIGNHNFIKVIADSSESGVATTGFFELLYNGNVKLLAQYKKSIIEKISVQYSESFFSEHDQYYILKNDVFYAVGDTKSAMNVLKDRKNDLAKFIHQNKIKFKKDPEAALYKIVAYYDGLNNNK